MNWQVGHQGDMILYFGSPIFLFWGQSVMWDQHDIFMPRKQETIGGSMLSGLLVFHPRQIR
jgi:hypothetical protein